MPDPTIFWNILVEEKPQLQKYKSLHKILRVWVSGTIVKQMMGLLLVLYIIEMWMVFWLVPPAPAFSILLITSLCSWVWLPHPLGLCDAALYIIVASHGIHINQTTTLRQQSNFSFQLFYEIAIHVNIAPTLFSLIFSLCVLFPSQKLRALPKYYMYSTST